MLECRKGMQVVHGLQYNREGGGGNRIRVRREHIGNTNRRSHHTSDTIDTQNRIIQTYLTRVQLLVGRILEDEESLNS